MALAEIEIKSNEVHYEFEVDGKKDFKVTQFTWNEMISDTGFLDISLINVDTSVDLDSLIGKRAKLQIKAGTESSRKFRFYHGIVQRFDLMGTDTKAAYYQARIVPRFWKLRLKRRSRVHVVDRTKLLKDVIKSVLEEHGLSGDAVEIHFSGKYEPYSFLTQYRESDFDFINRICEEDGVAYYIEHTDKQDVIKFVDSNQFFTQATPFNEVLFRAGQGVMEDTFETIQTFHVSHQLSHGAVEMRDYDFKDSHKKIKASETGKSDQQLEFYEYPGHFEDQENATGRMKKLAKLRQELFDHAITSATGDGDYRSMAAGKIFTLKGNPNEKNNRKWLCLEATHQGTELAHVAGDDAPLGMGGTSYSMRFRCMPDDIPYRPPMRTARPIVCGSQTAVVVGPPGEEIYTDEYGRIRVQLHWDRERKRDDKASFWVRVSQSWAGRKWGTFFLPRVGQEVVIDFLEGNPDMPICTGSVYNDYQRVPYLLPENKTRSTIKSNSSPGGVGFNEIRIEDKKDKEQIFIHAEKDYDLRVKNTRRERIVNNHHLIIGNDKGGDQMEKVINNKYLTVLKDQEEAIGGQFKLHVAKDVHFQFDQEFLWKIKGGKSVSIDGSYTETIKEFHAEKAKNGKHTDVTGDFLISASGDYHVLASKKIVLDGTNGLTIKGPGGFVKIDQSGVTIQGTMVKINSGGSPDSATKTVVADAPEADEAKPKAPTEADNDKTGDKSLW